MKRKVLVAGVGMIPFAKPGASETYPVMAAHAVRAALQDAGLPYDRVQQAYVGYVYGDSTAGQRSLYEVGMTMTLAKEWGRLDTLSLIHI